MINVSEYVDPCHSNPCQNGGTCSSSGGTHNCSCPIGYSGDDCETGEDAWPCVYSDNAAWMCVWLSYKYHNIGMCVWAGMHWDRLGSVMEVVVSWTVTQIHVILTYNNACSLADRK